MTKHTRQNVNTARPQKTATSFLEKTTDRLRHASFLNSVLCLIASVTMLQHVTSPIDQVRGGRGHSRDILDPLALI